VYHYSALACFADHAVVPQESCVRMESDVPLPVAAVIGCAVTTGMGAVLNTARVRPGSSVVIYGAGGVGLSAAIGARVAGASRVIAVDRVSIKTGIATSMGATDVLMAGPDVIKKIQGLTEGRGADYVFETTGLPEVQEESLAAVRPGGTLVLAGLAPGSLITRQEKTVMGTYYGTANPARDFPLFADMHLKGTIRLDQLITKTYTLDEVNEAFAEMLSGRLARGVIVFS